MLKPFLQKEIAHLDLNNLKRELRLVQGAQGSRVNLSGHQIMNFCSNNYLDLANDARLRQAAKDCMDREGFGSGASRLICGNMDAHVALEKKIAQFKETEGCLLFNTGYMANVGIISSLFDREDVIFADKLNHASIVDGIRLSQAEMKRYAHNDMAALEAMLKNSHGFKKRCIITDSVFSMDGDIAPLDKIVELAQKYDCIVMIDEAHAFGVLGKKGKGLAEYFGVEKKIDIQMGTLSKAAGSFGAYCCGSHDLITYLFNKARSFIYTTGLPASVAAASLRAVEIIEEDQQRRQQLLNNAGYLRAQIRLMGFETTNAPTPIIPIIVKDPLIALQFSRRLLERGIFVSAIRPPTVPVNTARLRITVMSSHTKEELDYLINSLQMIGKEICLI